MKKHYQFACVILTNGEHETKIPVFIPCSPSGLTEDEMVSHLQDYHNVRDEPDSDGLKDGFYWTHTNTAAAVVLINRENENSTEMPVYTQDEEYLANIQKFAPELISL